MPGSGPAIRAPTHKTMSAKMAMATFGFVQIRYVMSMITKKIMLPET